MQQAFAQMEEGMTKNDPSGVKRDSIEYCKLSKFGNNFGITFPKEMMERRQAKQGDLFEMVEDGENIIIRRVKTEQKTDSDYSWIYDEILKDLVSQGYEGEELVDTFQRMRQEVRPAIKRMLAEIEEQALKVASDQTTITGKR
jgi:antitoxin component of MazEF toxin-antitoxin module